MNPWLDVGWFLRIAIGANAIFYFAIFALLAFLADRRRPEEISNSALPTNPQPALLHERMRPKNTWCCGAD
jgi:hypothetical protein